MTDTTQHHPRVRYKQNGNGAAESPLGGSQFAGLGQRIRAARHEKNLSQDRVAQPHFTKSYISAVERGKVRPSLKALEIIAAKLELPIAELLIEGIEPLGEYQGDDAATHDRWMGAMLRVSITILQALENLNEAKPRLQELEKQTAYLTAIQTNRIVRNDPHFYTWLGEYHVLRMQQQLADAALTEATMEYDSLREARPDLVSGLQASAGYFPLLPAEYHQFDPNAIPGVVFVQ